MYALDTVKIVARPHYDTSDIPAHIKALFNRYDEVPTSEWSDLTTPAQKRTRTMRFNKFCAAVEVAAMDVPDVLFRLTNEGI